MFANININECVKMHFQHSKCSMISRLCWYLFSSETSSLNEAALPEQVKKLNRQNTENSQENSNAGSLRQDDRGRPDPAELILDGSKTTAVQPDDRKKVTNQGEEEGEEDGNIFGDSESEEEKQDEKVEDDGKRKHKEKAESSNLEASLSVTADICPASHLPQQRYLQQKWLLRNIIPACRRWANSSMDTREQSLICSSYFVQ